MEETPLDEIRWLTERRLGETKQRIREIAVTTNSELSLPALLTEVSGQRFGGDEVLPYTVELLQDLRQFALKRNIASVLSYAADPAVEAVPSLPRGALGKLHVPGPAESTGEAVLRLAMPLADAPKVGRLLLFGPYMLQLLSMREVYPGNYVRVLSRSESANRLSELRRLLTSRANREGWAHYAEEMFLDEGYGSADPLLRLVQLHQALVGLCRLVTTILIHAEGLSLETAARIFMNEAFLDASCRRARSKGDCRRPDAYERRPGEATNLEATLRLREQRGGNEVPSRLPRCVSRLRENPPCGWLDSYC